MAELLLGVSKKTKSSVWQHFGLRATEEGVLVEKERDNLICRSCGKRVQAKASNTTNLFQHLREHHPTLFAEIAPKAHTKQPLKKESDQPTLSALIASVSKYSRNSTQTKELNRAVAYYLLANYMS